jgi:osmotically-inducible protein OsmY
MESQAWHVDPTPGSNTAIGIAFDRSATSAGGTASRDSAGQYHQSRGRLYPSPDRTVDSFPGGQPGGRIRLGEVAEMGTTQDIREAVEAELKYDPLIDPTDISVRNINGDVALNGTVPSYPQYLEAAAAAQRVGGVKNVHNHLAVALPDGNYRDDATLTTAANNALASNITVPDGVEATAVDGNVTLTGMVKYGRQREAAELAVAGLIGVRNVRDEIDISYDADPFDVSLRVQEALDRNALISDDSDVTADTIGNTVTLNGHVRSWAEHDAAVGAAWMAGGVSEVHDDLVITG